MTSPTSLQLALERLCQPVRRRDYPQSLATMRALLAALGEPQRAFTTVVVTGSSGKSSLSHRLAALLQARGLRNGCYLSPHLHSFRERFMLDGQRIDLDAFCEGAALVARAADALPGRASTFERSTALALWWYRQREAPFAVLETGIGGRFDAVNAAANRLALFTRIEAEHREWLGGDLAGVAWHKAGILQPGQQAISVGQTAEVRAILENEARRVGATLHFTDSDLADAALANLTQRRLLRPGPVESLAGAAALPGRLERTALPGGPPLLIDGGHTAEAARFLRAHLEGPAGFAEARMVWLVAAFLADKDACAWLREFDDPRYRITLTRAPGHRAADPAQIAATCRMSRTQAEVEPDLGLALQRARQGEAQGVVVSGSLRLAAQVREMLGLLSAEDLGEAQLTARVFSGANYLSRLPP